MKKVFKRFITCCVAACIIAATAFAGACTPGNSNNNDKDKHTDPTVNGYTVTVLYPDDTPVKGSDTNNPRKVVTIQLVDKDGNDISGAKNIVDEYGVSNVPYMHSGIFLIDVLNCPNGFEYKDKVYTVEGRGDYTVKLSAQAVNYTINVKLPDGSPAVNVTVSIKQNGTVVKSAVTDTTGKAVIENVDAGTYDVEFTNLPEENVSYLPTKITASTSNLTVNLISLSELPLDKVMSDEKLDEWDKVANSYDEGGAGVVRFDRTAECYDFETYIPEGKKVYYYFTADEDGEYRFISRGKYYIVDFYGPSLDEVQNTTASVHESTNTCEMMQFQLKKGEKFYFSYSIPPRETNADTDNPDEHELSGIREFMIAKPVEGVKNYEIIAPTYSAPKLDYTVSFAMDTAIISLKTTEAINPEKPDATDGGIFVISSHTDLYDVRVEYYPYLSNTLSPELEDDDSGEGANFSLTIEVPPSHSGNCYYFKIIIKSKLDGGEIDYSAGVEVPITIERTGDAEENWSPVEDKHATATAKYADQTGKTFHFLLGDKSSISLDDFNIVERDGGYYVNIEGTERELVIAISKNICTLPYSYATIEYMGGDRGGSGNDDELPSVPSDTKQNVYLTLYTDPSVGEDRTNPKFNYAPFIEEYAALCNNDGVYKLNAELKEFAEKYYRQHSQDFIYGLSLDECCWLISCGYYA